MEAGNPDDLSTPFERYVETRWLARYKVMINIHKNWDTLKSYFELIIPNLSLGQKFEVKALLDMMKDESNHLLMAFLIPIVGEFEKLNAMFQATGSADAENAYDALEKCVHSLRKRVIKLFSPSSLFKNSPPQFADLPFTKDMELEEQGEVEQQYRLVLDENLLENSPFKELEVRFKEEKKYLP